MKLYYVAAVGLVAAAACNDRSSASAAEKSPPAAGPTDADAMLTTRVRKALQDDSSLSMDGKSAKVTVHSGAVTLRGTVKDPEEKAAVELRVLSIPGVASVDNQLSTKNP